MTADRNDSSPEFEPMHTPTGHPSNASWSETIGEIYSDYQDYFSGRKNNDKIKTLSKAGVDNELQCYWDWAQTNFALLDTDKNGFIGEREIDDAYDNPSIPKEQHYGLNGLRSFYQNIQRASNDEWFAENDGITREDLTAYKSAQLLRNWIGNRLHRKVDE